MAENLNESAWQTLTRPAPSPVQPSSKGTPQLAPVFSEWMMGLPAGWVTDPAIWQGMLTDKGKPATELKAELADVLFVPGQPRTRDIFQRDTNGHIIGFLSRREERDIVFKRIG